MEQKIITARDNYIEFDHWIRKKGCEKILMVCDGSIRYLDDFCRHLEQMETSGISVVRFQDFQPNPLYESAVEGVKLFREQRCDAIFAVGGGSAMDVAKCIKLYSSMQGDGRDGAYLKQEVIPNGIPFLAMPTTAGTGSEATRYAVIYYDGAKQSVTDGSLIPETVLLDASALKTLPLYQRKATMMDALCHGLESFWSVNSTAESKKYSREAVLGVMRNMDGYLNNKEAGNAGMLLAAHMAGKAINITQTTAGHAMCYKITGLFGCAHGHAAILCDRVLFPWMVQNSGKCIEPRGEKYLKETFHEIAGAMGCGTPEAAAEKLQGVFEKLQLGIPKASEAQYEELKASVNPERLKNHPIVLDIDTIGRLYRKILCFSG